MKSTLVLAGLCTALLAGSASAAVIVVRSSGPSASQYPVGKSLPDSATLSLKANDVVVLLDAKGSRTVRGPGSFPARASASSKGSTTSFAALLAQGNSRRGRVGAVRPAPYPRQLWQVSADASGTMCYVDPAGLLIHRENIAEARTLSVRDLASGKAEAIAYEAGKQLIAWPSTLPPADGHRYKLGAVEVTLKAVQPGADFTQLADALAKAGCEDQLALLGTATAEPAE